MIDLDFKYKNTISHFDEFKDFNPDISIVLGSGLGNFADAVNVLKTFLTSEIPGYPPSTVEGHSGKIHFAEFAGKKLILFQGRIHFYEGYSINECILPVFISKKLNCKKLLLTNAAGGINSNFEPGDLMIASSFNGINIKKELSQLIGIPSIEIKKYFLDFPSSSFNHLIQIAAEDENIILKEGVYWYTKGPSYETPAEVKMIQKFGSDAVGMSTVHEAEFAAVSGMGVAAISCITNFAAGISDTKLSHNEVTETAARVNDKFTRLVKRIINYI
jgi:purine-nucleoside phosphorylase